MDQYYLAYILLGIDLIVSIILGIWGQKILRRFNEYFTPLVNKTLYSINDKSIVVIALILISIVLYFSLNSVPIFKNMPTNVKGLVSFITCILSFIGIFGYGAIRTSRLKIIVLE